MSHPKRLNFSRSYTWLLNIYEINHTYRGLPQIKASARSDWSKKPEIEKITDKFYLKHD